MAFYSVRVNDDGTEIESDRTIKNDESREIESSRIRNCNINKNNNNNNNNDDKEILSDRSCVINDPKIDKNVKTNYKTVRYVNSAAFIEKESQQQPDNENNDLIINNDNDNEVNDPQYQSHIIMDQNEIPLLELNSDESFPSSNNMSYSYRKICEVTKMIQKPDAYQEWIDAKKTAKRYEKKRLQNEIEQANKEKERRKQISEGKFKEWLAKKLTIKLEEENKKAEILLKIKSDEEELKNSTFLNSDQRKKENFKSWLKNKIENEKYHKTVFNEQLEITKQLEMKRKELSAIEYEEWLKTVDYKPKPVPLNRGMYSLKGSISKMFINETPWQTTEEYLQCIQSL